MKRKESMFAGLFVIMMVAVIGLVSLPLGGLVDRSSTSLPILVTTTTTQSVSGLQVVKTNVTIHGMAAYLGACAAVPSCLAGPTSGLSLTVSLITYNGTYYYDYTGEIVTYGSSPPTSNSHLLYGSTYETPYNVWFTNSTVYCVTPNCPA